MSSNKRNKKRKVEEILEVPKPKACDRCKAVHKKCDGETPCKRCVDMAETCVYSTRVEETVFESLTKKNERLKSEDEKQMEARQKLQVDLENKRRKLAELRSTIELVQTRTAKFYKVGKLQVYIDWYCATVGKGCGIQVPYSDVASFLSDKVPIRSALMSSIIGCGALIIGDMEQARICLTEASNFAATYHPGNQKYYSQEANLFFNLGFYGFTSGNWTQSAASLQKLMALEQQFSEKLIGVETYLTAAQQQKKRVDLPADKDTLELYQFNNIITLATEVLELQLAQSPAELMKKKQRRHVPLNSVQEVRAKVRMAGYKIFTYMQAGAILPTDEINNMFSELLKEASDLDSIQKDLLTHLTMAVSVFAFHTSHQTTKAIEMCRKIMPLTEKLIMQMPCYVYPYANIFSVLPFLHVYQQNDLIEKINQIFRAAQSALGNLCLQQHHALVNHKPLQPFFSRTVGGWGQLKLPVIQFGSVAPQGMPSQVLQQSPMRTNEELQQTLAAAPQQQQAVPYQQTSANKRQRLSPSRIEEIKSSTPPQQNQCPQVTYGHVAQPVQQDRRQYVVARPQEFYPQHHGYNQAQQGHHYAQAYNQEQYPQQQYTAVVNETEDSSYSQEYQDPHQQQYDNAYVVTATNEYVTHPAQPAWAITAVAQTSNSNVYNNLHAELDEHQQLTHPYYVNTKHSGKHEDIL
eukprot:TRINITY_DN12682_c0_g1_i1.p1 TRINITY_DN12682_c0_g1~~TRINITY_DN12682_c0_g1_i1.p1  ORF type:complete len:691 (+),score=72.19 TRINITY_DN12682_c0_g1_i1:108-2180(+)